jgi:Coenzyme PQQ synthesis protein D (PqqD)
MKRIAVAPLPRKREHRLIIDELPDEVLVYDLDCHRAHCLNQTAALVWKQCDGRSTSAQIGDRLTKTLGRPFPEDLVCLALNQLEKRQLLEHSARVRSQFGAVSRRQMIRRLGFAGIALPLITSIIAPTPAQASTCAARGASCVLKSCCSGLSCNPITGLCP